MYTNEQLIEFCQEAVRIPSYSGQEKGVAEFMKRKMEEYGFDMVRVNQDHFTMRSSSTNTAACSAPSTANAPARRS